jgi:hypothetical protein
MSQDGRPDVRGTWFHGHDPARPVPLRSPRPRRPYGHHGRPWSVLAAGFSVAGLVAGLVLWIVIVVEDVTRLDREAAGLSNRSDGMDGRFFYMLYSVGCVVTLAATALSAVTATGWLLWRGRRIALAAMCVFLAATAVGCGGPSSVVAAFVVVSGSAAAGDTSGMTFDDALTAVHSANAPGWTPVAAVIASVLMVVGSVSGLGFLLLPLSRRHFRRTRRNGGGAVAAGRS